MKKIIPYTILVVVLYMFLFAPPFWKFRVIFGVSNIIALGGIILYFNNPQPVRNCVRAHKKIFAILTYLFIYSFTSVLVEGKTKNLTAHFLLFVNCFLVPPQLIDYARKHKIGSEEQIIRTILITIAVATGISIFCIVSPNFNNYIKFDVIKYSQDDFLFDADFRGFGFASLLTSNYGYILGFVAILGVYYMKWNKWFLFCIPFVLIAALLNARTGVLVAFAGYMAYLYNIRRGAIKYSIPVAIVGFLLIVNIDKVLGLLGVSDETLKWLSYFQDEIEVVASTRNAGESEMFSTLLGDMWVMPSNIFQWIFGRGFYLFGNQHGITRSDVGWVNQLNFGGLLYFIPFVYMLYLIYKSFVQNKGRSFGLFILTTILIVNTKGRLIPSYSLFYIIMLIMFVTTPASKTQLRDNNKTM